MTDKITAELTSIKEENILNDNVNFKFKTILYGDIGYYLSEAAKGKDWCCPKCKTKSSKINNFKIKPIEKSKDRAMLYCCCGWSKNIQVKYFNKTIETRIVKGFKSIIKENKNGI